MGLQIGQLGWATLEPWRALGFSVWLWLLLLLLLLLLLGALAASAFGDLPRISFFNLMKILGVLRSCVNYRQARKRRDNASFLFRASLIFVPFFSPSVSSQGVAKKRRALSWQDEMRTLGRLLDEPLSGGGVWE